jgi:hypothetical protein
MEWQRAIDWGRGRSARHIRVHNKRGRDRRSTEIGIYCGVGGAARRGKWMDGYNGTKWQITGMNTHF